MKIAINATFLNEKPTGAATFTKEIAKVFSRTHKEMILFSSVVLDDIPSDCVVKVPEGMKGSRTFSNNFYRFLYLNAMLPLLCRLKRVDVLYCPIMEFPFVPLVPLVVHIHDLHFIHFPSEFGLAAPRMKFSLQLVRRTARRVIVPSEFVKGELLKFTNIREDIIDVVPLACNDKVFRPMPIEKKSEFVGKYSLAEKYILFVGSLFPYKNLKTLVEAFSQIRNQIPHSLVIVGSKEFAAETPAADKRIIYTDYVPAADLPLFYAYADIFVHPSLREGFGITPLEAMACGTPVISSNGGSLPEAVGDAGIFFDPEDSDRLGTLILKVINDERLRKELVDRGFRHVKKFSWARAAENILKSCERAVYEKG